METQETTEQVEQMTVSSTEPVMVVSPEPIEGRRMKLLQRVLMTTIKNLLILMY